MQVDFRDLQLALCQPNGAHRQIETRHLRKIDNQF